MTHEFPIRVYYEDTDIVRRFPNGHVLSLI